MHKIVPDIFGWFHRVFAECRVQTKYGWIPFNLNNNWMTAMVCRSRHVTGWYTLVGGRIPYLVRRIERRHWNIFFVLMPWWGVTITHASPSSWYKVAMPKCANTKHLYNICTMLDVGPTLYKCYTNVLCLLGIEHDLYTYHAIKQKCIFSMDAPPPHCILMEAPSTRAKISGDVLATKMRCRFQTCGVTRKHTRDVLTNLREIFREVWPKFRRIFGDA